MGNGLFRMNDSVDIDGLLNDFQHEVIATIEKYKDEAGFPQPDEFGVSRGEVDDYLFEKQTILDSEGTERSRYTLAGVLIVLPIVVMAFFRTEDLPLKEYTVFPAMLVGLMLYGVVYATRKVLIRKRLRRLDGERSGARAYVDAVMAYGE